MSHKQRRDKLVLDRLAEANNKRLEIKRIAAELYLSERTIYNILQRCKRAKDK